MSAERSRVGFRPLMSAARSPPRSSRASLPDSTAAARTLATRGCAGTCAKARPRRVKRPASSTAPSRSSRLSACANGPGGGASSQCRPSGVSVPQHRSSSANGRSRLRSMRKRRATTEPKPRLRTRRRCWRRSRASEIPTGRRLTTTSRTRSCSSRRRSRPMRAAPRYPSSSRRRRRAARRCGGRWRASRRK